MAIVLLVAVVAAQGTVTYIVTGDDAGNSYYLKSNDDGTLVPEVQTGHLDTELNWGIGTGTLTNDEDYDFVVGTGYAGSSALQEIYLYQGINGNGNPFPNVNLIGVWSNGGFPADMPVAKFHGKVFEAGLDDFVMVQNPSPDVGFYKNDGAGAFTGSMIPGAAPLDSVGADAADINHDGYADFVVVQKGGSPPYYITVNLGDGNGNFATTSFTTWLDTPYWGITAADFNGDTIVDLIATIGDESGFANGFDFYQGDGAGGFTYMDRFYEEMLVSPRSPVDNYDLDGDGDQDLIVASVADPGYVKVGINNHYGQMIETPEGPVEGTFTFTNTYAFLVSGSGLKSLAAPPVFANEFPEAEIVVRDAAGNTFDTNQRIKTGTSLTFSSEGSNDPEGKDLTFAWAFSDDSSATETTHQFNTPGLIDVTLTVTDNYGAATEKTVTITVNYPPVAVNDIYSTDMNTALVVPADKGVLVNDQDENGDSLTAILVDGPTKGMFVGEFNADGSFEYLPSQDFHDTDYFTYKVNDGMEDSDIATVAITVNSPAFETWDVNIVPNMINLKSRGVFIAFITLPEPYKAADVDQTSVVCEGAHATRLLRHAKFPQAFGAIFRTSELQGIQVGKQEFTVTGTVMYEGLPYAFSGDDSVRVFTLKTRVRDDTEGWESHGEKKLFDDHYKWNKNTRDKKDNR